MLFVLYDRWGSWIAPLDGVADWTIQHTATEAASLELTLVGNTVQPTKGERIVWHDGEGWNEHLVEGLETVDDDEGRYTNVYCSDSITELRCKDVELLEGGASSSTLLNNIVDGTLWHCGTQGAVKEFSVKEVTALEALYELADAQSGIVKTKIEVDDYKVTKRTVSIVQPDTEFSGIRFDYGRNITSIERIVEEDDVYTKIIARGGSYTTEKQVWDEDIHDYLWKEVTEKYQVTVQDDSLLPYWGWPTKNGGRRHSEFRWSDDTISNENFSSQKGRKEYSAEVQAALEKAARKELAANGPRITYRADVELFEQNINVGQLAQITDHKFEPPLRLEGTVMRTQETPDGKTVTFGTIASTLADTILRQDKRIVKMTGESASFYA